MKKILSLLLVFALVFAFSGCGENTDSEDESLKTVCVIEYTGLKQTVTLTSKDDVVSLQENEIESDLAALGVSEDDANLAVEECKTTYNAIAGVTYSAYIQESILYETINIDYENTDFEALLANGFIEQSDGETPDYISLDLTLEGFDQMGYVCE